MGKVSKQLEETVFGANKEKAGEGRKFEEFDILGGRSERRGSHWARPSLSAARWKRLGRTRTPWKAAWRATHSQGAADQGHNGKRLEDKVLVLKFLFYMAKVID